MFWRINQLAPDHVIFALNLRLSLSRHLISQPKTRRLVSNELQKN